MNNTNDSLTNSQHWGAARHATSVQSAVPHVYTHVATWRATASTLHPTLGKENKKPHTKKHNHTMACTALPSHDNAAALGGRASGGASAAARAVRPTATSCRAGREAAGLASPVLALLLLQLLQLLLLFLTADAALQRNEQLVPCRRCRCIHPVGAATGHERHRGGPSTSTSPTASTGDARAGAGALKRRVGGASLLRATATATRPRARR